MIKHQIRQEDFIMKKVRSFKGKIVAVKRVKKNNVTFSSRENINHAYPEKVLDFYLVTECNCLLYTSPSPRDTR